MSSQGMRGGSLPLQIIHCNINLIVELRQSALHQFQALNLEHFSSVPTVISALKPRGKLMYLAFYTSTKYKYSIASYLCVPYDSEKERKYFAIHQSTFLIITDMERVYAQYGLTIYGSLCNLTSKMAVPWLKLLVADLWTRRPRFISKTSYLEY